VATGGLGGRVLRPSGVELAPAQVAGIQRAVLRWGAANMRQLPWRATRDPWHVLVSEVMLQQTQVPRVLGPYGRFVARFPTPRACAEAPLLDVLGAWQGLGYNRRAVNLHRMAAALVLGHGGRVPEDLGALVALPGVGPYTARAVLAFAFEHDCGIVDTNVARLLARAVAGRPLSRREAQRVADRLVPVGRSWAYNQTVLDIGSRHCAAVPDCRGCPLRRRCAWRRAGADEPDPARQGAGTSRRQAPFAGSDRQGRGRLVAALLEGPVPAARLASVAGWPGEVRRARAVAESLVADGLARWDRDRLAAPEGHPPNRR